MCNGASNTRAAGKMLFRPKAPLLSEMVRDGLVYINRHYKEVIGNRSTCHCRWAWVNEWQNARSQLVRLIYGGQTRHVNSCGEGVACYRGQPRPRLSTPIQQSWVRTATVTSLRMSLIRPPTRTEAKLQNSLEKKIKNKLFWNLLIYLDF